jgi:hypothetical protein
MVICILLGLQENLACIRPTLKEILCLTLPTHQILPVGKFLSTFPEFFCQMGKNLGYLPIIWKLFPINSLLKYSEK